jgi:hypothetical protein
MAEWSALTVAKWGATLNGTAPLGSREGPAIKCLFEKVQRNRHSVVSNDRAGRRNRHQDYISLYINSRY